MSIGTDFALEDRERQIRNDQDCCDISLHFINMAAELCGDGAESDMWNKTTNIVFNNFKREKKTVST